MEDEIELDNKKQLQRYLHDPPHPSYLAGFIDGDGCIFIRKITDGYQSGVSISQSRTNILQIIRYHFGGSITSSAKRNDKTVDIMDETNTYYHKCNARNEYTLLIRSNEYQLFIDYLQNSFIIKERQYQCLCQFHKLANLPNKKDEKEELYLQCSSLNKEHMSDKTYIARLNIEYIAGLFDAEGCLFISKSGNCNISIAQKNNPYILHEIVQFLGFGKVVRYETKFNKHCSALFIQLVMPHLIVKRNQAIAYQTYLTTTDESIKEKMYAICNKEKHKIEIFNELNQNKTGKDGYVKMMQQREWKANVCREIHNKQVYKDKSIMMTGEGNHNYGKMFSDETRKKMSVSMRNAKNGISDEHIMQVRELMQQGHKNVEIQKMLSISREVVTRIKNGTIVCRTEEKQKRIPLTSEQINLAKRKINADDIIYAIEKMNENWKPMEILNDFINKQKTNVTIHIIKNIKASLLKGKSVIYESELSEERYNYYLQLTKQFIEINT